MEDISVCIASIYQHYSAYCAFLGSLAGLAPTPAEKKINGTKNWQDVLALCPVGYVGLQL